MISEPATGSPEPDARRAIHPFELRPDGGPALRGEVFGDGVPLVAIHGLTATRRYVLHGSRFLSREGLRVISYDARGHGASDPAPPGGGYSYSELVTDLDRVLADQADRDAVLAGHSMGAHTAAARAVRDRSGVAALVLITPAQPSMSGEARPLEQWDSLADGLEHGGAEGFLEALGPQLPSGRWRDAVLAFTRQRIEQHADPGAVAAAIREVARSRPFESLEELESIEAPALVVASHDEGDPAHPYETAKAWADRLPHAELISEDPGEPPLAWKGSRLSKAIAQFCRRVGVVEQR